MCLIGLALGQPGPWSLVLAANRDEFHQRASDAAAWWPQGRIFAGRDRVAGGTWLGLARAGATLRIGALTNIRPGLRSVAIGSTPRTTPSRGGLVTDWLASDDAPASHLAALVPRADDYAGFNLLTVRIAAHGEPEAGYLDNAESPARPRVISPGFHAVSNATIDVPWPKTRRLAAAIETAMAALSVLMDETDDGKEGRGGPNGDGRRHGIGDVDGNGNGDVLARRLTERLFDALSDRTPATPADLPSTGLDAARERLLSSPFIVDPVYGTRCSTVILVGRDRRAWFAERRFDERGETVGFVRERITW